MLTNYNHVIKKLHILALISSILVSNELRSGGEKPSPTLVELKTSLDKLNTQEKALYDHWRITQQAHKKNRISLEQYDKLLANSVTAVAEIDQCRINILKELKAIDFKSSRLKIPTCVTTAAQKRTVSFNDSKQPDTTKEFPYYGYPPGFDPSHAKYIMSDEKIKDFQDAKTILLTDYKESLNQIKAFSTQLYPFPNIPLLEEPLDATKTVLIKERNGDIFIPLYDLHKTSKEFNCPSQILNNISPQVYEIITQCFERAIITKNSTSNPIDREDYYHPAFKHLFELTFLLPAATKSTPNPQKPKPTEPKFD